ncbi:MAG: DUF4178 domain-containing protein [Bernardetiaceae bacterium]|jgi:hypothetical protein|nr:DUF4178 domain-containing protein [Bernardetiaceae bacterium]
MNYFAQATQFKCPSCGGGLSLVDKRANYITCHYCGSVLDAQSKTHQVLTKIGKPAKFPPMSFVEIGQYADLEGVKYRVIGRTRWQMQYKEWDDEANRFADSSWIYDDWLLISEHGTYYYLVEDKEGFALSKTFWPKFPNLNQNEKLKDFETGTGRKAREYGQASVKFFEGESTFQIQEGDTIHFANYRTSAERAVVVEYSYFKDSRSLQEIKFWSDQKLSKQKVLTAFNQAENPPKKAFKQQARVQANQKRASKLAGILSLFCLACLLGLVVSCGNTDVFRQDLPVNLAKLKAQPAPASEVQPDGSTNNEAANVRLVGQTNTFELPKAGQVMMFTVGYDAPSYFDAWAGVEIVEASTGDVVNAFEYDLYRDDESYTSEYRTFKVDKPGTYLMRVYTETGATFSGSTFSISFNTDGTVPEVNEADLPKIYVEVEKAWVLTRYFLIGFLVSFTLLIIVGVSWAK